MGGKYHAAVGTFAPPPDERLFFMGPRVGYLGIRVKTIYAKHVYILTYRYTKS